MRIGVVLNSFPVSSEPFINLFTSYLCHYRLTVYAELSRRNGPSIKGNIVPYLNRFPKSGQWMNWIGVVLRLPFFVHRFLFLLRREIPLKQIIADAGIWTTTHLDILHFPFATNAVGREHYANLLGAKMTVSFRGSDINVFPVYHDISYKSLLNYVSAVHCNSTQLADKLYGHDLPASIPLRVIHPALRDSLYSDELSIKYKSLNRIKGHVWKIVSLGRLHWVKDYPLALRVMAILKQLGISFQYTILGVGPELEHLFYLRESLGLDQNVDFVGEVGEEQINFHFSNSDLYLHTAYSEGMSNSTIEAQAYGLPSVVPNISGMDEIIEHKKTGFIVLSRNEYEFAKAIEAIITSYSFFDFEYISKRAKMKFSIEHQREQWLEFFDSLLPYRSLKHGIEE